jgi:chaperonin GroEL (HSP60 family)
VVAGGGSALYFAQMSLTPYPEDVSRHIGKLFCLGLEAPITAIIENAGNNTGEIPINKYGQYICGKTTDVRNAFDDGVIDPAQVTINSLESAVSVAALLLMTDAAILTESL